MFKQKLTPYRKITDCLVIVTGLIILYFIFEEFILLYIASGIGVLSFLSKKIAGFISYIWNTIALIIGFFVSRILLGIIYFLMLFPLSIGYRLFSKNKSLSNKKSNSYWIIKDNSKFSFKKLW